MIAWEDTMASDIGPLFTGERLGTQPSSAVGSATNFTANTAQTAAYGTSTPGASSTPAGTANASNGPSPIKSDFEDLVINNINVRAIRNQEGQIAMLYSFIDNNTLLITTDEAAFKGIVNKYTTSKLIR